MPFLADPAEQYKESYLRALQEFQAEGKHTDENLKKLAKNFARIVQYLQNEAYPARVKFGKVPASEFWLVEDGEFIGRLSIRHELTEALLKWGGHIGYEIRPSKRKQGYGTEILRLGLQKARGLGLRRVLVTCDENNTGSKKVIERNGGRFENAVDLEGSTVKKLRYWITIP